MSLPYFRKEEKEGGKERKRERHIARIVRAIFFTNFLDSYGHSTEYFLKLEPRSRGETHRFESILRERIKKKWKL